MVRLAQALTPAQFASGATDSGFKARVGIERLKFPWKSVVVGYLDEQKTAKDTQGNGQSGFDASQSHTRCQDSFGVEGYTQDSAVEIEEDGVCEMMYSLTLIRELADTGMSGDLEGKVGNPRVLVGLACMLRVSSGQVMSYLDLSSRYLAFLQNFQNRQSIYHKVVLVLGMSDGVRVSGFVQRLQCVSESRRGSHLPPKQSDIVNNILTYDTLSVIHRARGPIMQAADESAAYGSACEACAKAKCRCIARGHGERCERYVKDTVYYVR